MSARAELLATLQGVKEGDTLRQKAVDAWVFVKSLSDDDQSMDFAEMMAMDLSFAIDVILRMESKLPGEPSFPIASLHCLSPPMHGQRPVRGSSHELS